MKYEQLEKFLDDDLAWRKKEISELLLIAKSQKTDVILKALILLLYAHWEGYIKRCSKIYIKYISELNVKIEDLSLNFKAVAMKETISRCVEQKDSLTLENELRFIGKYLKVKDKRFNTKIDVDDDFEKGLIDTQSNLKPRIFKNIIAILGLEYKECLSAREHYINSQLLLNRNAIGHGSPFDPAKQVDFSLSVKDIEKLKDIIFSIIDNFRDDLLDYADKKFYLEANSKGRKQFEIAKSTVLEKTFSDIEENYKK